MSPRYALIGALVSCLAASPAAAGDYPVAGRKLALRASPAATPHRRISFAARDAVIAPPFADPTSGSSLIVHASSAPGQCRAEIALDPSKWAPIKGDGATRGYRYEDRTGGRQGVRRITIRAGKITVRGKGTSWPCGLGATAQSTPVTVELRVGGSGGDRYCAAFGGTIRSNKTGRFRARNAPPPAQCLDTDLTVADLNILHGAFCPPATQACRQADRIDLLFQWIASSGCPDVVTFQEVINIAALDAVPLIEAHLDTACPFTYHTVLQPTFGIDEEMILSRYPVISVDQKILFKDFRKVLFARIDHPIGPVDVFSTHLASSSDSGTSPCGASCPTECVAAGVTTVRECQAVQMAEFIELGHDVGTPAVATGDFNDSPGTFTYDHFAVTRGWNDVYLAAGGTECEPISGVGCTSGRQDEDLSDMESPASNEAERIDFIFLVPPASGSICSATIDTAADLDGDGSVTGIFAGDPNPFAATCGPAPDPICWPSDHEGVELDLNCL